MPRHSGSLQPSDEGHEFGGGLLRQPQISGIIAAQAERLGQQECICMVDLDDLDGMRASSSRSATAFASGSSNSKAAKAEASTTLTAIPVGADDLYGFGGRPKTKPSDFRQDVARGQRGGLAHRFFCINLAFGAGLQDRELHPLRARRFLHTSDQGLGSLIVRVHQQGDHLGLGNQLGQQLEPLGHQLDVHGTEAREVASRPGETGDQPGPDRVGDAVEDDRDCRSGALRR